MLRHALAKSAPQLQKGSSSSIAVVIGARASRVTNTTRWYAAATSRQKRALEESQLQGTGKDATAKPDAPSPPPPPPAASGGGGGGDNTIPIVLGGVAALAAAGGAYYYFNMEPSEEKAVVETKKEEEEKPKAPVKRQPTSIKAEDGSNRVLQIELPPGTKRVDPSELPTVSHPEGGNRVTGLGTARLAPVSTKVSVKESLQELQTAIAQETSDVMKRANQEAMASFDPSLFEGLDKLDKEQLKARCLKLASEMHERTRWEALRLKEFLTLKEKETADKYLDVLQKQRLEFEAILARRLREQEHELATQANAKLLEKDGNMKDMVDDAMAKLNDQHEKEKEALLERKDQELSAKYEQEYMTRLEDFKQQTVQDMERKVSAMEAMSKKLKDLEDALSSSQNYHEGSLQAHRLSAAALALAEKMETNKGAAAELNALKAVAGKDNVISAALSSVPGSIARGVPTLPELQARFDKVLSKSRQAALVPAGQLGLEGQLAGMLFATLKFPPKPDDAAPEDNKDSAEYVLVRARQHVQYGELEKAIQQLDKLEGQSAFTVQGWKKDASDRLAVEQALKVIKMECALLNETMSNHP